MAAVALGQAKVRKLTRQTTLPGAAKFELFSLRSFVAVEVFTPL